MNIRLSKYDKQEDRVHSAPGSGVKDSFKMNIDLKGRRKLVRNGTIDIYAQIQSHKDSVDINLIIAKYMNGDESALSKVQGFYGDYTNIPTSLNDLQNRVMDAERLFYQLPLEVREKFEHNASMFYHSIGSDTFNEALGLTGENKTESSPIMQPGTVVVNPNGGDSGVQKS